MRKVLTHLAVPLVLTLALVIASGASPVHAIPPCYVNLGAAGADNGSSWTDAYTDLQFALLNAACTEVWVKAGVYKPGSLPSDSFNIAAGVQVFGGFAGTETLREQRNPVANVTILTGDTDNNDTNTDGNHIDETTADIVGNNAYHVVKIDGTTTPVTTSTRLDGFTITGGSATGGSPDGGGGGLYCDGHGSGGNCSPDLEDLTFIGNLAQSGGGIMNNADTLGVSSPVLQNDSFISNKATVYGGGLINAGTNLGTSSPTLENVTFVTNAAISQGGGIFNDGVGGTSSPSLTNLTFYNNGAATGGGLSDVGSFGAASPFLLNVTFSNNGASIQGGGVFNFDATPSFTSVILWGDTAPSGNEILNNSATPYITYSDVQGSGGSGLPWDAGLGTDGGGNIDGDPKLAPLAYNGGLTKSMALIWGSAAIDAGFDALCPLTDQRGEARWLGAHCDMGAYERFPPEARTDFDFNHTTDLGVFRPSTRGWFVKNQFSLIYGIAGDLPIPGDYDASGNADVAVFRPSTGGWFIRNQTSGIFGLTGDVPVPGDYDGNGTTDWAVYRPSTSAWYIRGQFATIFGLPGDIPVPGDYNGDGTTDIAVYRPSTSAWYIKGQTSTIYGIAGDIPIPADYDGNGTADIAVFRPSSNGWFVRGQSSTIYGVSGDVPVPGDYDGNGTADIAVFRPSTSGWFVKNQSATVFGTTGDYPLPAPDTNANGTPYQ